MKEKPNNEGLAFVQGFLFGIGTAFVGVALSIILLKIAFI